MSGGKGPHLFSPYNLDDLTLENRIVIAPMCQYSATEGTAGDWHMMHLGQLAISGAALTILEATAVTPQGRITPGDLGLYDDANEAALRHILSAMRAFAPTMRIGMQLAHAGRKASCKAPWDGGGQIPADAPRGWRCVAPSPLGFASGDEAPHALTEAEIDATIETFAATTRRAARLGLELLEIHAAHGYLLHQFLSPISNARTDRYGGSLENRMRLPLAVYDIVRAAFPVDRPVGVRVSATDWVEGGWDLDQTVAFAKALRARGCAYIHVSTGGLSPEQTIPVGPKYQVPFATRIKDETGLPTMAVGLITDPHEAEAIIAGGEADMVSLRPRHALRSALALARSGGPGRESPRTQPVSALAAARLARSLRVGMTVNAACWRERSFALPRSSWPACTTETSRPAHPRWSGRRCNDRSTQRTGRERDVTLLATTPSSRRQRRWTPRHETSPRIR